jgi:hypothetical protein
MDCVHMAHLFMPLYKALAASSEFFTIIDTDEYLYLFDGKKIVNDDSITLFLKNNTDVNFFAPCYVQNIHSEANVFSFNPEDLWLFHLSKPVVNSKMVPKFEISLAKRWFTILHHTKDLPLFCHGKTRTRFLLLHMKNLNRYQRIKSNMQKLTAFKILEHDNDFRTLLGINMDMIAPGHVRSYVLETRKLADGILNTGEHAQDAVQAGKITLGEGGSLQYAPEALETEFKGLLDAEYFELLKFNPEAPDLDQFATIKAYMEAMSARSVP